MTKVYLITLGYDETSEVVGVASTREKAESLLPFLPELDKYSGSYQITPCDLDAVDDCPPGKLPFRLVIDPVKVRLVQRTYPSDVSDACSFPVVAGNKNTEVMVTTCWATDDDEAKSIGEERCFKVLAEGQWGNDNFQDWPSTKAAVPVNTHDRC
jgi:hypothetical protein